MVRRVTIKNFKSIEDLSLDLGRCTILIGANGSGKSNILEAIALASAAASDKLDNEFLASRGIRVPDTVSHMRSAFESTQTHFPIRIAISASQVGKEERMIECSLSAEGNGSYMHWKNDTTTVDTLVERYNQSRVRINKSKGAYLDIQDILQEMRDKVISDSSTSEETNTDMSNNNSEKLRPFDPSGILKAIDHLYEVTERIFDVEKKHEKLGQRIKDFQSLQQLIANYIVFSLDVKALRTFETEGQILPLGIRGEGLFRLLKSILAQPESSRAKQIKEALKAIDWFSDFSVPENLMSSEYTIRIRDRYLADDLATFDQRSTNEGFLYLLFYFTLFCAEETPKFFALDNIDDSLNPRLSAETIKSLVNLAKEHDKQFIATTHQPGLLDGLDLSDPEQILYVVFRNVEGRTTVKRVQPPKTNSNDPIRLSEAFIRGYLGGLPNHF